MIQVPCLQTQFRFNRLKFLVPKSTMLSLFFTIALARLSLATYTLSANYEASNFFSQFTFWTVRYPSLGVDMILILQSLLIQPTATLITSTSPLQKPTVLSTLPVTRSTSVSITRMLPPAPVGKVYDSPAQLPTIMVLSFLTLHTCLAVFAVHGQHCKSLHFPYVPLTTRPNISHLFAFLPSV